MHVLSNISTSKGNQTMTFGQLIKCNMRCTFFEKSYTKCDGETSPRPFSEKLKLNTKSFKQFVIIICQVEDYQNILKLNLSCRPLACTSY